MGKLNALQVRKAKPGKHGDGDGLTLVVSENGARKWVLRIQHDGKRRDLGLGSAKDVSLQDARLAAHDMRRTIKRGDDPVAQRRRAKEIPTFRQAAIMVHEAHLPSWKNAKHAAQWLSSLEAYVFPRLGDLPVDQVNGPMVRDVLAEIWLTIPETARRVRQRIGMVLDFAHANGWREAEAPMRSVTRGLPKQPKIKEHLAAMQWQDVPAFVADMPRVLKAGEPILLALEFLILTVARSGEVRGARWFEINLADQVWEVPASRMKAGRAHRVPLSVRATKILARMAELRGTASTDAFVFEGTKPGRPLSDMSLTMPIRRAKLGVTVHGFRSSFRDWCADADHAPREIAEACLAHTVRNAVEASYARTDHFDKRRLLMERWANFVSGKDGKVVRINRSRQAG